MAVFYKGNMSWLLHLYIGASVFGAGMILIDLLGLLNRHDESGDLDHDAAGDDTDGFDHADDSGSEDIADTVDGHDGIETDSDADHADLHESVVSHDKKNVAGFIVTILALLRSVIYFSAGFGPTGWFALKTGETVTASLLWSVGAGLFIAVAARVLRRVQAHDLDSQIKDQELLMSEATVTVSVTQKTYGRVKIRFRERILERYALAANDEKFGPGESVKVTDIGDEFVIVKKV